MDREVVFQNLREEFNQGRVSKPTATKAMNYYNSKVEPKERITGCMCTSVKRKIYGRMMLEWYESGD